MNLQQFVTSEFGTKLWMGLGRSLPPSAGHALARIVAGIVSRRRHASIYRILYDNQAGVRGRDTAPEVLHQAVGDVLRHAGMTAYDLMHAVAQGETAIRAAVSFEDDFWTYIDAARAANQGVMICGCHTSAFNLAFLAWATYADVPAVRVLSPPGPAGGFKVMQELRAHPKVEDTPIDSQSLRSAIALLRAGGYVATGVDWPLAAAPDERVPFFGRPAHLPTGHIRLAISGNALLLPMACRWDPVSGYRAMTGEPLALELTGDRAADVQHNARRMLAVMERWIAAAPEQWLMYHQVWPGDDG
jgi:KDO2-lipid IV(A) lauroyltransferase